MASQYTHAQFQGPNGGTLHGPNGTVFAGPNNPDPSDLIDQKSVISVGTEDPTTSADEAYCAANIERMKFSRNFTEALRSPFMGASTYAQQYVNFTAMTAGEYASWVASEGLATVESWLMPKPGGGFYEGIGTGTERLCDFTNTDWLDWRLSTIPGWNDTDYLGDTNLSLIQFDLCPLFPVENLTDGVNPFGPLDTDYDTWKTAMIDAVKYMRQRIDPSIKIITNSLREFLNETQTIGGASFTANPSAWEPYDGTDIFDPGVASDLIGIEIDVTYPTNVNELLYSLRALARAHNQSVKAGATFKFDHSNLTDPVEERKRWSNLAAYGLVHDACLVYNPVSNSGGISPYPMVRLADTEIELGTPDQAVTSWFLNYTTPTTGLITRTFDSGYVVLFNWSLADVLVPSAYGQNYRMLDAGTDVEVTAGTWTASLTNDPNVPDYIPAGEGIVLLATTDYARVKLKLDGDPDTSFVNQADGYGDEHFILTPGGPQVFTDEHSVQTVLFNGETSYANVPYTPAFDKFFMRDSAPGSTAWSTYVEFEIDRETFADDAFQDVTLFSFKGLCDIFLDYNSGDGYWYPACRVYSTSQTSQEVTSTARVRVGKRFFVGVTRGTDKITISVKEEGEALVQTSVSYAGFPPTFDYDSLPEVFVGCLYNTATKELQQYFPGRIYGFAMFDAGGIGVAEAAGDLSVARGGDSVFMFLAEDATKDRMVDAGPLGLSCFFDFYSDALGRLTYTKGTRPAGSYLAALEGLALAESGPADVESGVVKEFDTSLRRSLDANVSSVKRGNKVFAVSNETSYVFDELGRKGRPIGIPKVIGNPSLSTLEEGVLDDVRSYGYRWVTSDGTKGPFEILGAINAGDDARIVIGESGLVLGLDYVRMGLDDDTQAGITSTHEPATLDNAYGSGTGFEEGETFTFENYVRFPLAPNVRERIWDAGMRMGDYQFPADERGWDTSELSGSPGTTTEPFRYALCHTQPVPSEDWEQFTHVVAFEIGFDTDMTQWTGAAPYTGFVCLSSRAPQTWAPNTNTFDTVQCPDVVWYDCNNSTFKFFNHALHSTRVSTLGSFVNNRGNSVDLNGPSDPLDVGDRVMIAHSFNPASDTHNIYIHIARSGHYEASEGEWYETSVAQADDADYVDTQGFFLGGAFARDCACNILGSGGGATANGYTLFTYDMHEMYPAAYGISGTAQAYDESKYVTWHANRLFKSAMSRGQVEQAYDKVFINTTDGAIPDLAMDCVCRPEDLLDGAFITLYDDYPGSGFLANIQNAFAEIPDEARSDKHYGNVAVWETSDDDITYQITPWRLWINEHYACPMVIPAKETGSPATADPVLAVAYTPFGDGSYHVFVDGVCVYRETTYKLAGTRSSNGTLVEGLSVTPQNFHWVTAEFDTGAGTSGTDLDLQRVFLGTKPVIVTTNAGTVEMEQNTPLLYVGGTGTIANRTVYTIQPGDSFPNEGGLTPIDIADLRIWAGTKYIDQQDFNLVNTHVPSDFYKDLWWYFDLRSENKLTGSGTDFYFQNSGTFSSNHGTNDDLTFDSDYHTFVGEDSATTVGLPTAPEPFIVGLELCRTGGFAFASDSPTGEEVAQKLAEARNGPYYLLDFIPRGQRVYIDNTPDINLGIPIDPTSGDYPRVSTGVARWGDHIVLYGDPALPSTLYVSEPGPTGWESYPLSLTFDTKLKEVTAMVTLGLDAFVFGKSSAVALGGDPTNPQEIDLGPGVGAQSPRAAGTFDGRVYAFNGRLWMLDPSGQAQDIGQMIQDILPTNGRIRFSAVHSSMYLIDEDDGRVIRLYLPNGQYTVEDRNARDCFESRGKLYWISRSGQISIDQETENSTLCADDHPFGLASPELTVSSVAAEVITVAETLPTSVPSAYDSTAYWDLKGVQAVVYPAAGVDNADPIPVTIASNTASTVTLESNPGGISTSDTLWLGANIYGIVLDTGWFFAGERDSVLRGVVHSIQTGSNMRIQAGSRDFQGDPTETTGWGFGDGAAVTGDGVHALGSRGTFHRVRVSSAPPTTTEASWVAYEIQSLKE